MTSMTPTQRRILWLMKQFENMPVACTGRNARKDGFGHWEHSDGGLVIRAYCDPLYHMRARGWLHSIVRNTPGSWYGITPEGRALQKAIKGEPPAPMPNSRSDFGRKRGW